MSFSQSFWVLSLLLMALTAACQSPASPSAEEAPETEERMEVLEVRTAPARLGVFTQQVEALGKLRSARQVPLYFRQSGVLADVSIKNGDRVKKGEILGSLLQDEAQLRVEQAKAEVLKLTEDYKFLFVDFGGTWGQPESLADTLREALLSRSGLRAGRLRLAEAELRLREHSLHAPFAGRVANLEAQAGSQVSPQTPFCTLYAADALELWVTVLQQDLVGLQKGQKAEVEILVMPKKIFRATLTEINPWVAEDGTVQIRLRLNETEGLLPGMDARVRLEIPQSEALLFPKEALVQRGEHRVVFVVENQKAQWKNVEIIGENLREVAVKKADWAGKPVIITSNTQLAHDTPVEVID